MWREEGQQNAGNTKPNVSSNFIMMGIVFILFITLSSSFFSLFAASIVYVPSPEALNPYYEGEVMEDVLPRIFGRKRDDVQPAGSGVVIKATYEGMKDYKKKRMI